MTFRDKPARTVTLKDVAEHAGVAVSTASRALANPGRVKAETVDQVRAAAAAVGYTRGRRRADRAGLSIALLVPDLTNPYYFDLVKGAERQARAAGVGLMVGNNEESPIVEMRQVERHQPRVDGFVLAASRLKDADIRELAGAMPTVLVNRVCPPVTHVVADQQLSVGRMVEHLASLGHRRIAYLAGPWTSWVSEQRHKIMVKAAEARGMETVRLGPFTPMVSGGRLAARAVLESGATAVLAHNALLALGTMHELQQGGTRVPEDVSIAACDDVFATELSTPALSARVGPMNDLGRAAVNTVLGFWADPDRTADHSIELPADFVIRGSTAAPRA